MGYQFCIGEIVGRDLTNNIVAILILHHQLQWARAITMQSCQLSNETFSLFSSAKLDTFLDDIGRKLVLGQCQKLC